MADPVVWATLALLSMTVSFPCYLYGAWIIIDADPVTWSALTHHLRYIVLGLTLTTVPVVTWMGPRLIAEFNGISAFHAILGVQAYALLGFALSGIVRILQVKRRHDLYHDPDQDVELDDLHENMGAWRGRLRLGVAGYVLLWLAAYLVGVAQYVIRYL
jgi:hypothetical protein